MTRKLSLYVVALSLMLAAVTLFWAPHAHFSWARAAAWTAFVLVFNVAGFITFPARAGLAADDLLSPVPAHAAHP